MMYATPHYYQELQAAFSNPQLVKQQLLDEVTHIDMPVDMSLSSLHNKTKSSPDIQIDLDHLSYERNQELYASYLHSFRREAYEKSSNKTSIKLEQVQMPALEPDPLGLSTLTSPPGAQGIHLKGNDGNLRIPSIVTKNNSFNTDELSQVAAHPRAKREFVPDNKKDDSYWSKRHKNNDSARRSRVKRKAIEKMMETRLLELQKENIVLKHEVEALRRRYGEEEGSSSDSSSSREKPSTNSPVLPPSPAEESSSKMEDDQQSSGSDDARSNDDSRMYSMRSVTALNHSLGPASRERADSVSSSSSSLTSGRISTNCRPDSRTSHMGFLDTGSCTSITGALDLTSDHCSYSIPTWDNSSQTSFSSISTNSTRRSSCVSSDSGIHEERLMVFPLKCRWKKEMQSA